MRIGIGVAACGLIAILSLTSLTSASQSGAASRASVVDLGHPLSDQDPTWSGSKAFSHKVTGAPGSQTGEFTSDEHFGTHLDAPVHFHAGGWTLDKIPVDRFVRPAVRIDVQRQVAGNDDYRVTRLDLAAFEQQYGSIPAGSVVLIATGWDKRWSQPGLYMNTRRNVKHFPGLAVDAARFLAVERKVAGIGIDTPSVDYGPSTDFEVHRVTQVHNVYHIENAARLTSLPTAGFTVVVAPINIANGSGGPTRVFALIQ